MLMRINRYWVPSSQHFFFVTDMLWRNWSRINNSTKGPENNAYVLQEDMHISVNFKLNLICTNRTAVCDLLVH